jgi:hypothetical protein
MDKKLQEGGAVVATPTDIEATIAALASIANANKSVTGIAIAYPNLPADISTPSVCYFVGAQKYTPYADSEDIKLETTTVYIRLYEATITVGIPGEVEDRIKGRLPLIRDELLAHPRLGKLAGIKRAVLIGSTGVKAFAYAGVGNYAGCEWALAVERIIPVTYATGE